VTEHRPDLHGALNRSIDVAARDPSEPLAVVYHGNTCGRRYAILLLLIGLLSAGRTASAASQAGAPPRFPIQTTSPQAQQAFDRGLELLYAFDYDAAIATFRQAAVLDPRAAMPHWGIAMALGPSLNDLRMGGRMDAAYRAAQQALVLADDGSPPRERDYVRALAKRYGARPPYNLRNLYVAYADAMRELAARYPDDPDASTLFAESLMLSGLGAMWLPGGDPGDGTLEAARALESVLARHPQHIGANHYYIHLLETSPSPERALPAAERLEAVGEPYGHVLHMASHIYVRLGDYRGAVRSNLKAVAADRGHSDHPGPVAGYTSLKNHSREFLSASACLTGQSALARRTLTNLFVLLRFNQWGDVLRYPRPDNPVARLEWAVARVLALVGAGRLDAAEAAHADYVAVERALPANALWWSDPVAAFVPMVRHEMAARLAWARGDRDAAVKSWIQAVQAQDVLSPGEVPPWPWFHSLRESLGAALFQMGRFEEAERVFREDLGRYRLNPRSLYGLWQTLESQRKPDAAGVRKQFEQAWADADVKLSMNDL
jgi:tetratricopeptide (TPR) repeat protein